MKKGRKRGGEVKEKQEDVEEEKKEMDEESGSQMTMETGKRVENEERLG